MRDIIFNTLNNDGLVFQIIRDQPDQVVLSLGIGLENGRCDAYVDMRIQDNQVIVLTVCPTIIPENKRERASEFITRANANLIIGCFDLNFNSGQIRYKSNYIFDETSEKPEEIFMKHLYTTFNMMDKYLPGIMSVVFGNSLPNDALSQIENFINPQLN